MTTDVITPAEALEEVERLKAWVLFNRKDGKWYVDVPGHMLWTGCGNTLLEAVVSLRERLAAEETMQRPGIQSGHEVAHG